MRAMAGGEKTPCLEAAVVLATGSAAVMYGRARRREFGSRTGERDLRLGWESNHRVQPPFVSPALPSPELPPSKRDSCRRRCRCRRRELHLCDSGRREWFRDFWDRRRSLWLFLPSPENPAGKVLSIGFRFS
ncbi:uncharacterized protein DS421_3g88170 [Arachis hypogaea]|nr:uncharacterized protein DS421_3g88170 [Arachis hypogaea]